MPVFAATDGAEGTSDAEFERLRRILVTGLAITVPLIVTLIVFSFAVSFVLGTVSPIATAVARAAGFGEVPDIALELLALTIVAAVIVLVGFVAEATSRESLEDSLDSLMGRIPGVGSLYTSFNEMSDFLLSNDSQSFREVKLVEYPVEGSYTVAFVTASTPERLETATGDEDMTTLFMPLAPNPVMGGFVLHVSDERVYDVDMTVEEGIRSIVTSGVAISPNDDAAEGQTVDIKAMQAQSPDEHVRAVWDDDAAGGVESDGETIHDVGPYDTPEPSADTDATDRGTERDTDGERTE
jgi:uncharacterized membrane protein